MRLRMACDNHPHCPPLHSGRQVWLSDQFAKISGQKITPESIRRWLYGETRAREPKARILAQILQVDPLWLFVGSGAETEKQNKVRDATVDGAVNVVTGIIRMDGATPAFPDPDDKQSVRDKVDIVAIICGKPRKLRVVVGEHKGASRRFNVALPVNEGVDVVGLIRTGMTFELVNLTDRAVAQESIQRGAVEIKLTRAQAEERMITSFVEGF